MSSDDQLDFGIVDDPTPPQPDAARLQRAVARGRQRLFRRRAMFGALTATVAFVLIGGGVAVAGRNDSTPDVRVGPPTTVAQTSANVREVDENGLHYTLTLETPVVSAGARARISFDIENLSAHDVVIGACGFTVDFLPPADGPNLLATGSTRCTGPTRTITSHSTFPSEDDEAAPTAPGTYAVVLQSYSSDALPQPFRLMKPFVLRVLPTGGPTPPTSTSSPGSAGPLVSVSPTAVATAPTTIAGAIAGEDRRTPHANDFSGTLTASQTSVTVGEGVNFELTIRNITDHVVEPALGSLTKGVAVICANDLSPLGHTGRPLLGDVNLFFVTSPSLAPLDPGGRSGTYTPTSADIGTVTCAGVIIATTDNWKDGTISGVAQLAQIPSVSFTVAPAPTGTTAAALPATSTTAIRP